METRLFDLKWDNSKMPRLDYEYRMEKRQCEGVQFSTGIVVLDIGVVWESMAQMEHNLKNYGNVEITFREKQEAANAQKTA